MNLNIKGLKAKIDGKTILNGIDLNLKNGEIHALMGPNGSGKSTLANVLMGHPAYEVIEGEVLLDGENILELTVNERARKGLFLAFQYPVEIPGVSVGKFLKRAKELYLPPGERMNVTQFIKELRDKMNFMEIKPDFINRYLNEGFSGGEKKRLEILQMLILKPAFAILDEPDSGLDIDALKTVGKGVNSLKGEQFCALIITHYERLLNHIQPDFVHILYKGKIITSGGQELVHELEKKGYDWLKEKLGIIDDGVPTDPILSSVT